MAADFPDVLDAMGCTPREFGSVHVHFEGFRVVDGQRCVASVLAQAAFVPGAPSSFALLEHGVELASAALPNLDDGRVVRLFVPLRRQGSEPALSLLVLAAEPPRGAQRVRQAWKLFDTHEVPRLSEMDPVNADTGDLAASVAISAITAPLFGAVVFRLGGSATIAENTRTTVHKAQALPAALLGPLLPGVARPVESITEETVWRVGQPLPEAPPMVPLVRPAAPPRSGQLKRCAACGFEGDAAEYERSRCCPTCGESWL